MLVGDLSISMNPLCMSQFVIPVVQGLEEDGVDRIPITHTNVLEIVGPMSKPTLVCMLMTTASLDPKGTQSAFLLS